MAQKSVLKVENLAKTYRLGKIDVEALRGVSFQVDPGEFVAIMGPSGCGKSTLMHLMGCLDRPTSGSLRLEEEEVSKFSERKLAEVRNKKIGFVFQRFNLLPRYTALENVELPLIYAGVSRSKREQMSLKILKQVGLEGRGHHKPTELSGGQIQRVAIARAIILNPSIILADEPTGNLDTKSGDEIIAAFQRLNKDGSTIVMVTHEPDVVHHAKRVIHLLDGKIVYDEPIKQELLL